MSQNERERIFSVLKKFIWRMYSKPQWSNVIPAITFSQKRTNRDLSEPLAKQFKNFNATNLIPNKIELHQKLLRTPIHWIIRESPIYVDTYIVKTPRLCLGRTRRNCEVAINVVWKKAIVSFRKWCRHPTNISSKGHPWIRYILRNSAI